MNTLPPQVTGIGGLFFRARDPEALAAWYQQHFGINTVEAGPWQQQAGPTVFAPFSADTEYFGRPDQPMMVNFRVQNLEGLVAQLAAAGVRLDPNRESYEYGDFAWVYDPEDNKIELWEPRGG
ncbi:MAG: VOC family protein [Armatimonadetes bacterium]|nr:VOC family protein [Armatimonadota bacterium]